MTTCVRLNSVSWVLIIVFLCGTVGIATGAGAQLVAYEPFDYADNTALGGQSGGSGWSGSWLSGTTNYVRSANLYYTDGSGNTLAGSGTTALTEETNYDLNVRSLSTTYGADGTSLWFSVIVHQDTTAPNSGTMQLNSLPAGMSPLLYVGCINGSTTWRAAVWASGTFYPDIYGVDLGPSVLSMTFIVGRVDFGATTDNYHFWTNPTLGTTPSDASAVTLTGTPHIAPGAVTFQSGTAHSQWDEFRLGSTYADVTPIAASAAPVITIQPAGSSISSGATASLWVNATGTAPLSYQWYEGNAGDTSIPVGTSLSAYTTPALTVTTSYWVRVSNGQGTADSDTATITVGVPVELMGLSID